MTRIITVTSGKGGVGKTNISANLALHLASLGYSTCLFDADLGLANINILLKIYPDYNLQDVILHHKDMKDILIKDYEGMDIIPGSSGVEEMANLKPDQTAKLIREFSKLDTYDYFIIDTAAGISRDVISFCLASSELMVIITPDPTSLTDAYSLLKILTLNGFKNSVMVVINQSPEIRSAKNALYKFKAAATKYLGLKLIPLGVIGRDQNVVSAVSRQKPFIMLYPNTPASKSIKIIAQNLIRKEKGELLTFTMEKFWEKCLNIFTRRLKTGIKRTSTPQLCASGTEIVHDPLIARPSDSALQRQLAETTPPLASDATTESDKLPLQQSSIATTAENTITLPADGSSGTDESAAGESTITSERDVLQEISLSESQESSKTEVPEIPKLIFQTNQLLTQVAQNIASVAGELKEIRELFAQSKGGLEDREKAPGYAEEKFRTGPPEKDINQLTSLLASYSKFQFLDDNDIKNILESLKLKEYQPDDIVIKKGEPGKNFFIIVSGKVAMLLSKSLSNRLKKADMG